MCAMNPVQGPTPGAVHRLAQTAGTRLHSTGQGHAEVGSSRASQPLQSALGRPGVEPASDPAASKWVSKAQMQAAASMTGASAETRHFQVKKLFDRTGWPAPGDVQQTRQDIAEEHAAAHRANEEDYRRIQQAFEGQRRQIEGRLAQAQQKFESNWSEERAELARLREAETKAAVPLQAEVRSQLDELEKIRRLAVQPGQEVDYSTHLSNLEGKLRKQGLDFPRDESELARPASGPQQAVNQFVAAHRRRLDHQQQIPANPEGEWEKARATHRQQQATLVNREQAARAQHDGRQQALDQRSVTRTQLAEERHREDQVLQAVRSSSALKLMGLAEGEPERVGDRLFIRSQAGRAELVKEGNGYRLQGDVGVRGDTTFKPDPQGRWVERTRIDDGLRTTNITRTSPEHEEVYTKNHLSRQEPPPVGRPGDAIGKDAFLSQQQTTVQEGQGSTTTGWRNLTAGGVDQFHETQDGKGKTEGEYRSASGVVDRWNRYQVADAQGKLQDHTVSETTEKHGKVLRSYELKTEDLEKGRKARTGVETTPQRSRVTREVLDARGGLETRNVLEHETLPMGEVNRSRRLSASGYEFTSEHSVRRSKIGEHIEERSETITRPDGSSRVLSKEKTHHHMPRPATSEDRDLPGRGYYPWSNPQDLLTEMEAEGEKVQIQEVTREITGEDGKTHQHTDTKLFTKDQELIREVGPNGKWMWTRRVRNKDTQQWDSQVFYQGSSDTVVTSHRKDGPYLVESRQVSLNDHPDAASGRLPQLSFSRVSRREATASQLDEITGRAGIPEAYRETEAVRAWMKSVGEAPVKVEIRESDDKFIDARQNRTSVSVVLDDGKGHRLILVQDSTDKSFGSRYETTLPDGTLASSNSLVSAQGERWESKSSPTEEMRSVAKLPPDLKEILTRPPRNPGVLPAGLAGLNSGLAAVSAVHDFANGDVLRGLKNSGDAAQDLSSMALALRESKGLSNSGLSGISGAFKTVGLAGAGIGAVTAVARIGEGEVMGGLAELGAAGLTGLAFFVPGYGWAAAVASAVSFGVNTYSDTRIATPTHLGGHY